eukprot:tig00000630_g2725.t1
MGSASSASRPSVTNPSASRTVQIPSNIRLAGVVGLERERESYASASAPESEDQHTQLPQRQDKVKYIELVRLPTEVLPASESGAGLPHAALAVDVSKQKRCRFSTQGPFQLATSADSAFWVSQAGRLFRWRLTLLDAPGCDGFEEEQPPELPVSGLHPGARDRLKQVACGAGFVLALSEEGALFARGSNGLGQLGQDGDVPHGYSYSFLRVPYKAPVAAVSAGHAFAALLTAGGEVATWGDNSHGQLGHGPALGPLRRPRAVTGLHRWKACTRVACGPQHVVAVDHEGTLLAWGRTGLPHDASDRMWAAPGEVPGAPRGVVQVACGGAVDADGHTALLTAGGEVHTFGRCAEGQLGHHYDHAAPEAPCYPAQIDASLVGRATHVSCGAYATYFRTERGEMFRLGLGRRGPQQIIIDEGAHVASVVCSSFHAIAVCDVSSARAT